jgi:hypothetical protein
LFNFSRLFFRFDFNRRWTRIKKSEKILAQGSLIPYHPNVKSRYRNSPKPTKRPGNPDNPLKMIKISHNVSTPRSRAHALRMTFAPTL